MFLSDLAWYRATGLELETTKINSSYWYRHKKYRDTGLGRGTELLLAQLLSHLTCVGAKELDYEEATSPAAPRKRNPTKIQSCRATELESKTTKYISPVAPKNCPSIELQDYRALHIDFKAISLVFQESITQLSYRAAKLQSYKAAELQSYKSRLYSTSTIINILKKMPLPVAPKR